jgi:hypothetical protein
MCRVDGVGVSIRGVCELMAWGDEERRGIGVVGGCIYRFGKEVDREAEERD